MQTPDEVIEFLTRQLADSIERMDRAAQVMEDFIEVFKAIEEQLMKERMKGGDDDDR